jgi:DNA-binding NarL/FixJ family response regulator
MGHQTDHTIGLPTLNGIEAARQIRKVAPSSEILFLSGCDDLDTVRQALDTGATGYVIKSDAGGELISAVEAVFQGKRFVSRRLEGRISADAEDPQAPRFPWPQ